MAISNTLQELKNRATKESDLALKQIAEEYRQHIVSRTLRGIGTNERRFVPYAPSTARRKGVSRQPVTLRDSFRMLSDLHVKRVRKEKFEVRFRSRDQERKGLWQQFGTRRNKKRHIPARRWFGYTTRFQRQMFVKYSTRIRQQIPKDRRRRFLIKVG